ncbi:MAG: hypothetical protein FWF91_03220 [Coriobacteriia bacterium]|nr:hypothetical protein [Coriobacteriia bacterium]
MDFSQIEHSLETDFERLIMLFESIVFKLNTSASGGYSQIVIAAGSGFSQIVDTTNTGFSQVVDATSNGFQQVSSETSGFLNMIKKGLKECFSLAKIAAKELGGWQADLAVSLFDMSVSAAIDYLADYWEKTKNLEDATRNLKPLLGEAGSWFSILSDEVLTVVDGFGDYVKSADDVVKRHADIVRGLQAKDFELNMDASAVKDYVKTIERLAGKTRLGAKEQAELEVAVEGVNAICGTNISVLDSYNGKLDTSVDSIKRSTKAWEDNARAQQSLDTANELIREHALAVEKLKEAELKLDGAWEIYQVTGDPDAWIAAAKDVEKLQQNLSGLEKQIYDTSNTFSAHSQTMTSSREGLTDYISASNIWTEALEGGKWAARDYAETFEKWGITTGAISTKGSEDIAALVASIDNSSGNLYELCEELGLFMPKTFFEIFEESGANAALGFVEGLDPEAANELALQLGYNTLDELKRALAEQSPSKRMMEIGIYAAEGFAKGISDDVTSALAAEALASGALAAMGSEAAPDKTNLIGKDASSGFAQGIGDGLKAVDTEGKVISAAAKAGLRSENGNATSWGNDLVGGLASGIRNAVGLVTNAASFIAGSIKSFLHFSRPDEGPLKDYERWMPDMVFGLALSMRKAAPVLFAEARALAQGISENINEWELSSASLTKGTAAGLTAYRPDAVALQGREATNNYYTIGDVSYTPDSRVAQLMSELTDILIINRNMEVTSYA